MFLLASINGKLLAQGEIFQDKCVRTFSEQPNKPKSIQQEGEHGCSILPSMLLKSQ
jgi:hypothetical protein